MQLIWPVIDCIKTDRAECESVQFGNYWEYLQSEWKSLIPELRCFALRRQRWYLQQRYCPETKKAALASEKSWAMRFVNRCATIEFECAKDGAGIGIKPRLFRAELSGDLKLLWTDAQVFLSDDHRFMGSFVSDESSSVVTKLLQCKDGAFGLIGPNHAELILTQRDHGFKQIAANPQGLLADFLQVRWMNNFNPKSIVEFPVQIFQLVDQRHTTLPIEATKACIDEGLFPRRFTSTTWFDSLPGSSGWRRCASELEKFLYVLSEANIGAYIPLVDAKGDHALLCYRVPKRPKTTPSANEISKFDFRKAALPAHRSRKSWPMIQTASSDSVFYI